MKKDVILRSLNCYEPLFPMGTEEFNYPSFHLALFDHIEE